MSRKASTLLILFIFFHTQFSIHIHNYIQTKIIKLKKKNLPDFVIQLKTRYNKKKL